MTATVLAAGFDDPSHEAQRVFRSVLDAFAHPGRIVALPSKVEAPAPLCPATAAFLLTLVDRDTPLWLAPSFRNDATIQYVRFHTGAPLAALEVDALFAIVPADPAPLLDSFAIGTDAYPDRSTTLVIEVPSLRGGPSRTLRGPGIETSAPLEVAGIADAFWREWAANRALFPCGVDVVFAAGTELLALPRGIAAEG